jgi:hypothetical protein
MHVNINCQIKVFNINALMRNEYVIVAIAFEYDVVAVIWLI